MVGAVKYSLIKVKTALSPSGLPDIDYALNPYVGCAHGCTYCYARSYVRDQEVSKSWGGLVRVKVNLIDVLRRDVRRFKPGVVGIATITDPYQPIEASWRLTRSSIVILLKSGFKVDIQTKSPLVLRDIDVLSGWGGRVEVGLTITTLDDSKALIIEPNAPSPSNRASALRELSESGITTWVFLGPIIPGVNDSESSIREVIGLAAETGSQLIFDRLRIKPEMIEPLSRALKSAGINPAEVIRVARSGSWIRRVEDVIKRLCSELGAECVPAF